MTTKTARTAAPVRAVTLSLVELRDLIAPVLPHADYGQTLPVLGCVQFRTEGKWLIATATDRYTIGVCRYEVPAGTNFNCLVQAVELKAMLAMFRPGRSDGAKAVTLTIDKPMLRVTGASAMFAEASVAYNLYEGDYPNTRSITAEVDSTDTGDEPWAPWAINGRFMTRFNAALRSKHEPLVLSRALPHRPMFVRAGSHFLGAIMPVRGGEIATDWKALFQPVEKAAPKTRRASKPKAATA